jgi:HSP20 family molecular chaperone IbpA
MLDTVDRVFEAPFFSTPATTTNPPISASLRSPWDVMEDEDSFRLRIDMPGLSKEEVS